MPKRGRNVAAARGQLPPPTASASESRMALEVRERIVDRQLVRLDDRLPLRTASKPEQDAYALGGGERDVEPWDRSRSGREPDALAVEQLTERISIYLAGQIQLGRGAADPPASRSLRGEVVVLDAA